MTGGLRGSVAVVTGAANEPREVAAAAAWLLSDEAAFCCGTELLMDGGYSLV
jgi:NAD(P)-dependent dehydrogenase (short-subunit alcohol dehydrogenase family)